MPHTPGLRSLLEDPGTGHGSTLAAEKHGGTPPSANNPLAGGKGNPNNTIPSTLHSDGDPTRSYSLNGSNQNDVNQGYQQYNDGVPNNLPKPSLLDINNMGGPGFLPTSNLTSANNGTNPMNNSFVNGTYFASAPPEGLANF